MLEDVDNISDHLPLILELNNSILDLVSQCGTKHNATNVTDCVDSREMLNWPLADHAAYYELTRVELFQLHSLLAHNSLFELQWAGPDICSPKALMMFIEILCIRY